MNQNTNLFFSLKLESTKEPGTVSIKCVLKRNTRVLFQIFCIGNMHVFFLCSRYTAIFKSCLATHNSQCSQSVIDVYDEVFEMMLPEHHCDKQSLEQIKNEVGCFFFLFLWQSCASRSLTFFNCIFKHKLQ